MRFAPSPTGVLHVGSARSALFNWVVARQSGGALVLRIEDTDAARNRPEWTDGIVTSLAWLGITPDQYEGPFLQSDNLARHQATAAQLYEQGRAYYCDCTRDMIVARTGDAHRGYDGFCRDRGLAPGPGRALRFRTPDEGATVIDDLVRGKTTFENATLEDFVIARADGSVLFLLANVVDDISQRISLVIRAEEHLSNTPKQQLLWVALGQEPPGWAHVPIIVNEKRQKLSKRRDKVALEDFRDEGYLASAMRNYLMLLGWSPPRRPGDRQLGHHRGRVPARGREPLAGVLRRQEAARVQRRVHPGAAGRGVRAGLRAVADRPGGAVAGQRVRPGRVRRAGPAGPDPDQPAGRHHRHGGLRVPRGARDRRGVVGQGHEGAGGRRAAGRRERRLRDGALAGR